MLIDKVLRDDVKQLKAKLGTKIKSHGEVQSWFIYNLIKPYLRKKLGIAAEAVIKQNRYVGGLQYDAKVGGLLFEFKRPEEEVRGKKDVKKYIDEFNKKGKGIECFVTNGWKAVYVDKNGKEQEKGPLEELLPALKALLSEHAPEVIDPKDLVDLFGPQSDICRFHLRDLWCIFSRARKTDDEEVAGLVNKCLNVWRRVYAEVTNLNPKARMATKKYADSFGISISKAKSDVENFLFVIETYLRIFMDLFIAGIATQNNLIHYKDIRTLLKNRAESTIESFSAFRKIPFLKRVFEYDVFDWYTEPARKHPKAEKKVEKIIQNLSLTIDKVKLSGVKTDLFRKVYQKFFNKETRRALGEFYTNEKLVDEVLDSVRYRGKEILDKTVLDPACGSGTFLLRAIKRFKEEARKAGWKAEKVVKQITKNIWGIDIHPFAVTMAKVNYLLATSDLLKEVKEEARKLELPIYWSDSLATFAKQQKLTKTVEINITPFGKLVLPDSDDVDWGVLFKCARDGAVWKWSLDIFLNRLSEETGGETIDLYRSTLSEFYKKFKEEEIDARWLPALHNMLIVYKFRRKCDFILSNPPWIRKKNVEPSLRERLSENFDFYKEMWKPPLKKYRFFRGSMDYSVAFIESGLGYLKDDGRLGFVITSNVTRNLYAGNFRKKLITDCALLRIKDYSFISEPLFEEAQNAPLILALEKRSPSRSQELRVGLVNRNDEQKEWTVKQSELPLLGRTVSSWMVLPPKAVKAVRKMREGNPMLGDIFYVGMGVKTAANGIFFIEELKETDRWPDTAFITTTGGRGIKSQKTRIETELIRPLVRGGTLMSGVTMWRTISYGPMMMMDK